MKLFRILSLSVSLLVSASLGCYYLSAKKAPPRITQEQYEELNTLPCVVLGGGVGGLTAANYLALAGHQPLVFHTTIPQEGGLIAGSHHVQNWPGEIEMSGAAIIKKLQNQTTHHGALLKNEKIIAVNFKKYPFTITTQTPEGEEKSYRTLTCIITLGATPNYLGIPGEQEWWGRGVSNCAICDGPLYKGKKVAIVGGGDSAVTEALFLSNLAQEVHLFIRKNHLKTNRSKLLDALSNIEIHYESEVKHIFGDAHGVTSLEVKTKNDIKTMPMDALFLAIGSKPNSALFKGQINPALDSEGYIDPSYLPVGVFAAGDMCDKKYRQAVTAAGDACKAAIDADDFIKSLGLEVKKPKRVSAQPTVALAKAGKEIHKPVSITTHDDLQALAKQGVPYVVDFYADWCGACVAMKPVLEKLEKEFAGKMGFYQVNVDHAEELSRAFSIRGIPAFIFFDKNGVEIKRVVGSRSYKAFLDECKEII